MVRARQGNSWTVLDQNADSCESFFNVVGRPRKAPGIGELRAFINSWRFYDHFRINRDAPCRQPQLGTRSPVLHHDVRNLASALQTIIEIGEVEDLVAALENAFPGGRLRSTRHRTACGFWLSGRRDWGLERDWQAHQAPFSRR